jgi:hypothetical protein
LVFHKCSCWYCITLAPPADGINCCWAHDAIKCIHGINLENAHSIVGFSIEIMLFGANVRCHYDWEHQYITTLSLTLLRLTITGHSHIVSVWLSNIFLTTVVSDTHILQAFSW